MKLAGIGHNSRETYGSFRFSSRSCSILCLHVSLVVVQAAARALTAAALSLSFVTFASVVRAMEVVH